MSRWQTIFMLAPSVILLVVVLALVTALVLVTAEEPPPPAQAMLVRSDTAAASQALRDFTVVSKVRNAGEFYIVIMFAGREREVSMFAVPDDCFGTPIGAVLPRRCR